jgi:ferredoxin
MEDGRTDGDTHRVLDKVVLQERGHLLPNQCLRRGACCTCHGVLVDGQRSRQRRLALQCLAATLEGGGLLSRCTLLLATLNVSSVLRQLLHSVGHVLLHLHE